MNVRKVDTKADTKAFLSLPYRLYARDPLWVPPMKADQRGQISPGDNPFLDHCDHALFILEGEGRVIGRIAAFIDELALEAWGEKIGLFGYFECEEIPGAAELLLSAAREWLRERGMARMRGPWSFVSQEWGSVVEGFAPRACVMAPYNPAWYNDAYRDFGFAKAKDLLCWEIDAAAGYVFPERFLKLTDAVAKRNGVRIRSLRKDKIDEDARLIFELSNASIIRNWGFTPVTEAELGMIAAELKPIIKPECVVFAEDEGGRAIGFALAIPDVNEIFKELKGSLLPFGWIKLLRGLPKLHRYRMFGLGVLPEYHGKGIDSLLYRGLYESLFTSDAYIEINYVLEDNLPMVNAIAKLGAKPLRRYRVFEMGIN